MGRCYEMERWLKFHWNQNFIIVRCDLNCLLPGEDPLGSDAVHGGGLTDKGHTDTFRY